MRCLFYSILVTALAIPISAIGQIQNPSSSMGGVVLRSNGMGFHYSRIYERDLKPAMSVELEAVNHRHSREMRILSTDNLEPGTFSYGKLNHVGLLRMNIGIAQSLNNKNDHQNPVLQLRCHGGMQIAALKPIYLRVLNYTGPSDGFLSYERFQDNPPTPKSQILGEAPFSYGLNETSFRVGLHINSSVLLQWTNQSGGTRNVEMGVQADFFRKGLPVMALSTNRPLTISYFISFLFGKNNQALEPSSNF